MAEQEVVVPDIGGGEGAEVIEILVAVGDTITLDQSLIVLESDKASMEIPSTVPGVVTELLIKEGDELTEGSPIVKVDVEAAASPDSDEAAPAAEAEAVETPSEPEAEPEPEQPAAQSPAEPSPPPAPTAQKAPTAATPPASDADVYAGPAVRKLAREFGVTLTEVEGSGPSKRVLKEDVQDYVRRQLEGGQGGAAIPEVPEIDFAQFGEIDTQPRSKLDKLTANNMHRSWLNVPHVTQFDDADITDLEEFRASLKPQAEQRQTKITPLPFLLKACAVALRDNPRLNSSLSRGGEDLVEKHFVHIGMAVDTPAGLVVPVVRDVNRKTIWELADEVIELASLARDRKLKPAQMQGGCFTISSLGAIGGTGFTPIVNTPELAILGVSKASIQPVWNGSEFVPRKLLPLSLSYDHRAINGGDAGRFMTRVVELLSDIRQLSM